MKHLGLFEGIGGFSLAARWMGWETVAWVEKNRYCQQVLRNNFPDAKGYDTIEDFDGLEYTGFIDVVTGGEPCQGNSTAGSRKGMADHRFLWPEYFRVVKAVRPKVVVNENVRGSISNRVLDKKIFDLEGAGYTCWPPLLIPSGVIGAQHRRDRVWLVAYSDEYGSQVKPEQLDGTLHTEADQPKSAGAAHSLPGSFIPSGQKEKLFAGEPPLVRGDNGIPKELDAIAAIGNSADPRIIYEIFKAIESVNQGIMNTKPQSK